MSKQVNTFEFELIDDFSIRPGGEAIYVEVYKNKDGQFITISAFGDSGGRRATFYPNIEMLQSVYSDELEPNVMKKWD